MKIKKVYADALTTLAKGTDAGIYRLNPKRVEVVSREQDVKRVLAECEKTGKSVTFKAGRTSLSGQTIIDSVLMEISPDYGEVKTSGDRSLAKFSCGITGEEANHWLKPYGRKLGPSLASIKSARIGGIVANNSSSSSYGIIYNSYNTARDMEIIFADGAFLDTSSLASHRGFMQAHIGSLEKLVNFRLEILLNPDMEDRILSKYKLKNTYGYGMNSFLDYTDLYDILMHLMVNSGGTLRFISSVTFETVPDGALKASALVYFPSLMGVCRATAPLRQCKVSAAELMDRDALHAVEDEPGMPEILHSLPEDVVALLINTSSNSEEELQIQLRDIEEWLADIQTLYPVSFTTNPKLYATYWRVRDGLFTFAAGRWSRGTVSTIEDIVFREEVLGEALEQVRGVLSDYGYGNAVMWGHLLDGNVHFTIFLDINAQKGIDHYASFMRSLTDVILYYDGSLKAKHDTGRNMAPFVKDEWGEEIYELIWKIKRLFDPENILNPGVLLNRDPDVFMKNLKQIPLANELIGKCIECGSCEIQCPSRHVTLIPRQRIVIYRELLALAEQGETNSKRYKELKKAFSYKGNATCATGDLCATACPVGINTGLLIKELRWKENGVLANAIASGITGSVGTITGMLRPLLKLPRVLPKPVGYNVFERFASFLFRASAHKFPFWTRHTPSGASKFKELTGAESGTEMAYFPSCIIRTVGASADYGDVDFVSVTEQVIALLTRADFTIRYPENLSKLCCGMAFSSKGFRKQTAQKAEELNEALLRASDNDRLPILCDMSPCLLHMGETLGKRLQLYEPVESIHNFMRDRLNFTKLPVTVVVHSTYSTTKMGVQDKLVELAGLYANRVVSPSQVICCDWAGDRGFFYPELNVSGLHCSKPNLHGTTEGYSNSRTCKIGLTMNSGISYKPIVYLAEEATR